MYIYCNFLLYFSVSAAVVHLFQKKKLQENELATLQESVRYIVNCSNLHTLQCIYVLVPRSCTEQLCLRPTSLYKHSKCEARDKMTTWDKFNPRMNSVNKREISKMRTTHVYLVILLEESRTGHVITITMSLSL